MPSRTAWAGLPDSFTDGGWSEPMQCPTCGQHSPDAWKFYSLSARRVREAAEQWGQSVADAGEDDIALPVRKDKDVTAAVAYMRCGNSDCKQLMIRVHERERAWHVAAPITVSRTWLALPRNAVARVVDESVPEHYRRDFSEAADILDRSPRMSAVLSRRILADLLEEYAGKTTYNLADRIDSFIKDTTHPHGIRENLQHLRELGDFSAHTKKTDQAEIISVEMVEAEWTLDIVERLFDYLIVTPAKDAAMRAKVDQKIKDAGRKPIPPPPDRGP